MSSPPRTGSRRSLDRGVQLNRCPPSTLNVWPVIQEDSGRTRKRTQSAMSWGRAGALDGLLGDDLVEHVGLFGQRTLGGDQAGRDRVDRDLVRPGLAGERAREPDDPALGGHVGGQAGIADEERGRGDVDDPPVALAAHGRIDRVAAQEHAVEVGGQHVAPLGEGELLERDVGIDAGVVDQHVDPSVPGEHVFAGAMNRLLVGHVDAVLQIEDLDRGAVLGQSRRDRCPDPAGAAGDDGHLAIQVHGSGFSHSVRVFSQSSSSLSGA